MHRRILVAAAGLLAVGALTAAAPASSGELCYDLDVDVAGNQLVDEEGCESLPGDTTTAVAAGQLCYAVDVQVNGDQLIGEESCEALPI